MRSKEHNVVGVATSLSIERERERERDFGFTQKRGAGKKSFVREVQKRIRTSIDTPRRRVSSSESTSESTSGPM